MAKLSYLLDLCHISKMLSLLTLLFSTSMFSLSLPCLSSFNFQRFKYSKAFSFTVLMRFERISAPAPSDSWAVRKVWALWGGGNTLWCIVQHWGSQHQFQTSASYPLISPHTTICHSSHQMQCNPLFLFRWYSLFLFRERSGFNYLQKRCWVELRTRQARLTCHNILGLPIFFFLRNPNLLFTERKWFVIINEYLGNVTSRYYIWGLPGLWSYRGVS